MKRAGDPVHDEGGAINKRSKIEPLTAGDKLEDKSDTAVVTAENEEKSSESAKPIQRKSKAKIKKNYAQTTSRTKKCGKCEGCLKEECGQCQTCRINYQFQNKLQLGTATCLKQSCLNPIPLSGKMLSKPAGEGKTLMESMMQEQDDNCCPYKIIDGTLYDLRCYMCKKLPRAGMANRSELYRHYSVYHFSKLLIEEYGHLTSCPIQGCAKGSSIGKGKHIADHMGQVHNKVDKHLPPEHRIPLKMQKSSGGSRSKPKKKKEAFVFPAIPEGYDIRTNKVPGPRQGIFIHGYNVRINTDHVTMPEDAAPSFDLGSESDNLTMFDCCICHNQTSTCKQIVHHLALDHRMTLDNLPEEEDMLGFLTREGFIRESSCDTEPAEESTNDSIACEQAPEDFTEATNHKDSSNRNQGSETVDVDNVWMTDLISKSIIDDIIEKTKNKNQGNECKKDSSLEGVCNNVQPECVTSSEEVVNSELKTEIDIISKVILSPDDDAALGKENQVPGQDVC